MVNKSRDCCQQRSQSTTAQKQQQEELLKLVINIGRNTKAILIANNMSSFFLFECM
jgi:hypothetical protein